MPSSFRPLGLVASSKRRIRPGKVYDRLIPKPSKSDPIINLNGTVHETVEYCRDIVRKTLKDTEAIAPLLKKATLDETCKAIYDFVFNHVQYEIDNPKVEQLRRPARLWADRKGDCDCYSITISSILSNLGVPHFFRIIKINNRNFFQHIYVIVPKPGATDMNKRSNYYVIDPVLDKYDLEAPKITEKKDRYMENLGMPIQFLNGIGRTMPVLVEAGESPNNFVRVPDLVQQAPARQKTKSRFGPDGRRGTSGLGLEFTGLEGLDVTDEDLGRIFLNRTKQHLVNTRDQIKRNPRSVARIYKPKALAAAYDELIGAWDNEDSRTRTLDKLSAMDETFLQPHLQGLGDLIHGHEDELFGLINGQFSGLGQYEIRRSITGLGAAKKKAGVFTKVKNATKSVTNTVKKAAAPVTQKVSATAKKAAANVSSTTKKVGAKAQNIAKNTATNIKTGAKKAAVATKQAAQKAGKAIAKYNPVSLAARAGFLVAMRTNFGKLASRAYWGAFPEADARRAGVTSSYWSKAKKAYDKLRNTFVNTLKGDEPTLRKAVITGRAAKRSMRGLNGLNGLDKIAGLRGLGADAAPGGAGGGSADYTATLTAAMNFLTPLLSFFTAIFSKGNGREETETGGETEPVSSDPLVAQQTTDPGPTVNNDNSAANYQEEMTNNNMAARTSAPAAPPAPEQPLLPAESPADSQPASSTPPAVAQRSAPVETAAAAQEITEPDPEPETGMSTETKIGLGLLGGVAVVGIALYARHAASERKKIKAAPVAGLPSKVKTIKIK